MNKIFWKITLILISIYLAVDSLNGLILRYFNFSISIIYKFFILSIMLIIIIKYNLEYFLIILFIISTFTVIIFLHFLLNIDSLIDFVWSLKYILIIVSYFFFKVLIKNNKINFIKTFFSVSLIIFIFNIFIGILGFGYSQYGGGVSIGTRGLFYGGNEVNLVLIILEIFFLSSSILEKNIKKYFLLSLLFMGIAALLTSKVALFGTLLIILIFPIINFFIKLKSNFLIDKSSYKFFLLSFFIFFVLSPIFLYISLFEMNLIIRISYWLGKTNLITLVLSNRNVWLINDYYFLQKNNDLLNYLVGFGYKKMLSINGKTCEMDLIDEFMLFGIIGVVIIYGFFIIEFLSNMDKKTFLYPYAPYIEFSIILFIIISIVSGHVMNSGLASILIGAVLSLNYYINYISKK